MFISILIILLFVAILSYFWIRGIDIMKENHPDYRGKDFFDEEDDIHVL
jgi:hypothetical protein